MIKAFFMYTPFAVFVLLALVYIVPTCRAWKIAQRGQASIAAFLLFCCSKFLCYRAFGGDAFNPDLPQWLIWTWNWLYSGAMLLFVLAVALFFVPRRVKAILLPALAWALAAWGVWNGVKIPKVNEVEIQCPGLPAALDGYRIVQVADIHVSAAAPRWRTEAIVALANAADADLAVCTGDIVDGTVHRRRRDVEPLKAAFTARSDSRWASIRAIPHAREALEALRAAGCRSFVYTHRGASSFAILENTGLAPYLDEVLTSESGFPRKPDPAAILYLLDKYALDPAETYYVGDRRLDMEAAHSAGVGGILFREPGNPTEPTGFERCVISDLREIQTIFTL